MSKSALRNRIKALAGPCLALAAFAPVSAYGQPDMSPVEPPKAGLRIFASSSLSANWFGSGAVRLDAPLCLTSSTGNYRLSVTPSAGLQALTQDSEVRIGIVEPGGKVSLKPLSGLASLYFTGSVDPRETDCGEGANAQLIVELPERALMAADAGNYFDQLQLEIEAL